jgi:hypothetical protein
VRVVAALSAVAALPLVLVLGVMANDTGTPAGAQAGLLVLLSGSALIVWVILCCVIPALLAGWFHRSLILRMLLVDLPPYAFALVGLSWCATRVHIWIADWIGK